MTRYLMKFSVATLMKIKSRHSDYKGAFIDKGQFRTLKKKMYRAHFEIGFLNVVHIYNYCIYIDGDLFIRIPSRDAERLVISTAKNCFVPIYYTRPY